MRWTGGGGWRARACGARGGARVGPLVGRALGRAGLDGRWCDSSHSILNEFMHAEYGIFVYTISDHFPVLRLTVPVRVYPVYMYAYAERPRAPARRAGRRPARERTYSCVTDM